MSVEGPQSYDVMVGWGLLPNLLGLIPGAKRVAVLHTLPLAELAGRVEHVLRTAGITTLSVEVPDAEAGKDIQVAVRCWDLLGGAGFTTDDAVVAVGGGALTDLAGFVASRWLCGIRWVPVATSIVNMVDAAIGSKTGINIAEGKNLVGAFHSPSGVLCDLSALQTLPTHELASGLAEVVKCGFIADPEILNLIEQNPTAAVDPANSTLRELIERAVRVKAKLISVDMLDSGVRQFLNYGHTLGHAIEKVESYSWRHGSAVSVGMVYAAALSRRVGRLDTATANRHRTVLQILGLPTTYRPDAWPALLEAIQVDKKRSSAGLRFIVLDGLARPSFLDDPPNEILNEAYQEILI